jgi:hypothetical protein
MHRTEEELFTLTPSPLSSPNELMATPTPKAAYNARMDAFMAAHAYKGQMHIVAGLALFTTLFCKSKHR